MDHGRRIQSTLGNHVREDAHEQQKQVQLDERPHGLRHERDHLLLLVNDIAADTRNSADAPRSIRSAITAPSAACARAHDARRDAGGADGSDAWENVTRACFPATAAATASDSRGRAPGRGGDGGRRRDDERRPTGGGASASACAGSDR